MNTHHILYVSVATLLLGCEPGEQREVGAYSAARVEGNVDIVIENTGDQDTVFVACSEDVETTVEDDVLIVRADHSGEPCEVTLTSEGGIALTFSDTERTSHIRIEGDDAWIGDVEADAVHIDVTSGSQLFVDRMDVRALDVEGDGQASVDIDTIYADRIETDMTGQSALYVHALDAGTWELRSTGGASIQAGEGELERLDASVRGNATVDMGDVEVEDATIDARGSAQVSLEVLNDPLISLSGSADVSVY